MNRYVIIIAAFLFSANCFADTFVNLDTGETLDGYATSRKKGPLTSVRSKGKKPQYIDLYLYKKQENYQGRKNKVQIFVINQYIDLVSQTQAFEKAIVLAADQGMRFILIEFDTPGIRPDLAQRISQAILKIKNCRTVGFVNGGRLGGAFEEAAIVAASCDSLFMKTNTAIGSLPARIKLPPDPEALDPNYAQVFDMNDFLKWQKYALKVAEQKRGVSHLIKAMVDENLEIIEVNDNGKTIFIEPKRKHARQLLVRRLTTKGQRLRLTAQQAYQAGVADGLVNSRKQLLALLNSADASQVRDSKLQKTKNAFLRGRRLIKRMISSIILRNQVADDLSRKIEIIEKMVKNFDEVYITNRYGLVGGRIYRPGPAGFEIGQWNKTLVDRDNFLIDLTDVLDDLIRTYRRTIRKARRYPDFEYLVAILQDQLEATQDRYEQVRRSFRFSY